MVNELIDGKYEIISKIGSGGTSIVYKARRLADDKIVAIKIIRDELDDIKEHERHFRQEAQALFQMSHRNIRRIFSVGQWNDSLYMVTEYIDGLTLKDIINEEGPLEQHKAIDYALQIASGIEHAHRKHIIHRDIKPQNIIVSNEGVVKIVDFGIARMLSQTTRTMGGKDVVGSVHYISPEQAKGIDVDSRTDIYSFGVLMYEMFTGKVPFEGVEAVSIAIKHVSAIPAEPKDLNPEISDGLNDIIKKCMQKDPDLRYQTASDIKEDLLLYVANPDGFVVSKNTEQKHGMDENGGVKKEGSVGMHERTNPKSDDMRHNSRGGTPSTQKRNIADEPKNVAYPEKHYGRNKTDETAVHQGRAIADATDKTDFSDRNYGKDNNLTDENVTSARHTRKVFLIILALIASAALVAGIVMFAVTNILNSNKYAENAVPSVAKLSKNAAVAVLREEDFSKFSFVEENSSEVQEGSVIRTEPEEGTYVTVNTEITIVVSSGARTLLATNTVGLSSTEAASALEEQGFKVKYTYIEDNTKENGIVVEQSNTSQALAEGSYITLTVVRNIKAESIIVPDLSDCKTITEAKNKITEAGFIVGKYQEEKIDDPEKLGVGSQYPSAGTEYVYMSGENPPEVEISFTLYISSGYKCMYEYTSADNTLMNMELLVFDTDDNQIAYQKFDSANHITYIYTSEKAENVTFELYSGNKCIDKKVLTTSMQQVN